MRPISLTLAGLQSYREAQTIDFTALCDAGVFGIFGPTGSGKSTILDAITLALYGSVERAAKDTQGIMNQAEHTLSVSFTFELRNADGSRRYRVDRQFKRNGEVSVKNTVSRLVHLQDDREQVVLADKMTEVNAQVQAILGLSMEDFTRAVVLPQGKFAEFLSLKGSDRRQMLQRLFNLEPYGDKLNAKVSARFKETDAEIRQIIAEQQGLGDASEEALAAASERLKTAAAHASEQRKLLREGQARFEERKQVRQWQQEKLALERQHAQLLGREADIRQLERLLEQAEQAERLRPYLEAWEAARQELLRSESELQEAAGQREQAAAECERASQAYAEARERLSAEEAPLLVRLEQLKQAQAIEAELAQLQRAEQEVASRQRDIAAELESAAAQLNKEEETRDKALHKQSSLKEELKSCEVAADVRQRLQAAFAGKQKLDRLREQLRDWAEQRAHNERELERLARQEAAQAAGLGERLAGLEPLLAQLAAQFQRLQQAEAAAGRLARRLPAAIERARAAGREREVQRLAALLAGRLTAGQACPVCGSTHHPAPARAALETEPAAEEAEQLEALLRAAQEAGLRARQLKLRLDAVRQQVELALPQAGEAEAAAARHPGDVAVAAADGEAELTLPAARKQLQEAEAVLEEGRAAVAELERQARRDVQEHLALSQARQESASQLKALQGVVSALLDKETAAKEAYDAAERDWKAQFPELAPERVEAEIGRLAERDRKAEELRGRLEKSVEFIDGVLHNIQAHRQRMADLGKEQAQLAAQLAAASERRAEKERELRERVGDESADKLAAETAARLERLRGAERERKAAYERAQAELQQAGNRYSAALQAHATARQALAKAEEKWQAALAKSAFASPEEVRAAYAAEADKQAWNAEVQRHRELERQLAAGLRRLDEQLRGRTVGDEEWLAAEREMQALQAADEQALEAKARAERDLEELQAKHRHWRELEERRMSLQNLHTRLGKLQSVLRANAFVEFIAEEQLMQVSRAASERLGRLTRQRYALEVDSGGGFVIRDDANGGVRRPVTTLSGGETFLTSLALALALSAQIQLRGQYPLEFFFLDEGFGTLDPELLETVISALEKLHMDRLAVGVISHVPELRARLPRRLIVHPAEPTGRGSRVSIETL